MSTLGRAFPNFAGRSVFIDDQRVFPIMGGGSPPAKDPFWSNVVLMMGFDGTDATSPTLTPDESLNGYAVDNVYGNAQIDTGISIFDGSLLLDGAGDAIGFNDQTNFSIGSSDFTIDAWMYLAVDTTGMIASKYSGSATTAEWFLLYNGVGIGFLSYYGTGSNSSDSFNGTVSLDVGTWHHVAYDRQGDNQWLYAGGTVVGSMFINRVYKNSTEQLRIGGRNHPSPFAWHGNLDEVRITKGVARYGGSSFTVPTAKFPRN